MHLCYLNRSLAKIIVTVQLSTKKKKKKKKKNEHQSTNWNISSGHIIIEHNVYKLVTVLQLVGSSKLHVQRPISIDFFSQFLNILIKRSFASFRFFFHILSDILTNNFKSSFLNLHSLKEFDNVCDKTKNHCRNDFRKH